MPEQLETLTILPDWGRQRKTTPRVDTVEFGENYAQRTAIGINRTPKVVTLNFNNRRREVVDELEQFFDSHGGVSKFLYAHSEPDPEAPPGANLRKYVSIGEYTVTEVGYNRYNFSITIKEVP